MIKKQIQYERQPLKLLVMSVFVMPCFALLIIKYFKELAIVLVAAVVLWLVLRRICGSLFSIRHSHVGRQLMKYGDLKSVIQDVEEQAAKAWYVTHDQAITEKYLMVMRPNEAYNMASAMFVTQNLFYIVSTGDMERVEIQTDWRYADEMNTLVCHTMQGEHYEITVYRSREEVQRIKAELERCIRQGIGPKNVESRENKEKEERWTVRINRRKNLLMRPAGYTVAECYAKKKKIFWGVTIAIVLVLVGMLTWFGWMADYSLERYLRDIYRYPKDTLLVAAMYIIPLTGCYIFIRRMESQVKKTYDSLKHFEREEVDKLIAQSPEISGGEILYAQNAFWFRDASRLLFHNLVRYEDVLWIYPSKGAFQPNVEGVDMPTIQFMKIVFHTRDGKKHSILMADWNVFSSYFPYAIKGYGKQQKKAYREFLK